MGFVYSFTEAELLQAFLLALDEEDARELATDAAAEIQKHSNINFSEETLMLLVLLGPATAAKVEEYRNWRRQGRPASPEEELAWATMKREIGTSLGSRVPQARTDGES